MVFFFFFFRASTGDGPEVYAEILTKNLTPYVTTQVNILCVICSFISSTLGQQNTWNCIQITTSFAVFTTSLNFSRLLDLQTPERDIWINESLLSSSDITNHCPKLRWWFWLLVWTFPLLCVILRNFSRTALHGVRNFDNLHCEQENLLFHFFKL